jgi:hypothetical protein
MIAEFWDTHIPFIISVHNGYEYYAVSIKDGSVVHGYGPDFESVNIVAKSLFDFIGRLIISKIII